MAINFNSQINSLYAGSVSTDAAYQSPGTYGIPSRDITSGLTAITVDSAGTGFTGIPTVTISLSGGGAATAKVKVISATVAAGGSGGTNGTQTVTGTTGTGTKFQASVTVAGGAITAVLSITTAGSYSVFPTAIANEPVTGANLTGAQLAIVMGIDTVTVTTPGQYGAVPAITFTGAGGSGATATAVLGNLATETRMLTMIEVIRSYFASCSTPAEAYAMRDCIREMMGRVGGGRGTATFDASALGTRMTKAGVRKFATQPRADT